MKRRAIFALAIIWLLVLAAHALAEGTAGVGEALVLTDNLIVVEEEAFAGCGAVSAWLPDGVTSIGAGAIPPGASTTRSPSNSSWRRARRSWAWAPTSTGR